MTNIKCSDSDIPPEARDHLYAEWTKFRDWLAEDGMTGCVASYRAGYIAAFEAERERIAEMFSTILSNTRVHFESEGREWKPEFEDVLHGCRNFIKELRTNK